MIFSIENKPEFTFELTAFGRTQEFAQHQFKDGEITQ